MFIKKIENRYREDEWAWEPWFGVVLLILLSVFFAVIMGQRSTINDNKAELALYEVAMPKWKEFERDKQEELAKLKKERDELTIKYEVLQCSTRGLVVTTVKGITLCMNPETKALHKIDGEAN